MPIGALLDDGLLGQEPILPHHAERSAVLPRTAGIGKKTVFVDQQRILGLDDLDGRIGHIAEPVGPGVLAVLIGTAAAARHVMEFHVQKPLAVRIDAGDGQAQLIAARTGRHTPGIEGRDDAGDDGAHSVSPLPPRTDGGGKLRVDPAPLRRDHGDRAVEPHIVRRLGRQQGAEPGIRQRRREPVIGVQRATLLRRGAGIVGNDLVALHRQLQLNFNRPAADAVVVIVFRELGLAVRELADAVADEPLGVLDQRPHIGLHFVRAVRVDQFQDFLLARDQRRDLRADVAHHLVRDPRVVLDHAQQRVVGPVGRVDLARRNPQPFLINLVAVGGLPSGHPAAQVRVVQDQSEYADPYPVLIDRTKHEDIVEMARPRIGVVAGQDVPRPDVVAEVIETPPQRRHRGPEMPRQRQALRHHIAVRIEDRCREIHIGFHQRRARSPQDRHHHVVGHHDEGVLDELEADGIDHGRILCK